MPEYMENKDPNTPSYFYCDGDAKYNSLPQLWEYKMRYILRHDYI
jgi:hypothetical protein